MWRLTAFVSILTTILPIFAAAQATDDDRGSSIAPHQIPRVETRIEVDGVLDEEEWGRAWSTTLDFEVRPGENTPAPIRTEVLVMHDANRLYVGFRAHDPDPQAIRAHLADRDQAWADDWVGVVLDTFNDERRSYLFLVNPLGVQMDGIEVESSGSTPWDGIWKSAAVMTDWGWSVELEIPFSTLRFQRSAEPQVWGFDAIRSFPRNVDHRTGAFPRDRSNNCYLCQAHKIEGFAGVSPGRNIEIVPTLTASRTDEREDLPNGEMVNGDPDIEIGLTARWGVTPNLTLSGTINPDFSQVEADALQLTVNRPFAIFFPELRPFFMEGADFFDTPMNVVYTRMMREPEWGLKLTGKEGAHTIGAYVVDDEITNLIIPGSESSDFTSLEQPNTATVLRYKYDVGNRFTLGGIFTNREGTDYLNRVAGIDGDLRLSSRDRVIVQLLRSTTRYPEEVVEDFDQPEGTIDDWAAEIYYSHSTRTWMWWALLRDVGTDFRADLGFMPQVDYQHREAGVGYQWNATETSWYSRMDIKAKVADTVDQNELRTGKRQEGMAISAIAFTTKATSGIGGLLAGIALAQEITAPPEELDLDPFRECPGLVIRSRLELLEHRRSMLLGVERQRGLVLRVAGPIRVGGVVLLDARAVHQHHLAEVTGALRRHHPAAKALLPESRQVAAVVEVGMGQDDRVEVGGTVE